MRSVFRSCVRHSGICFFHQERIKQPLVYNLIWLLNADCNAAQIRKLRVCVGLAVRALDELSPAGLCCKIRCARLLQHLQQCRSCQCFIQVNQPCFAGIVCGDPFQIFLDLDDDNRLCSFSRNRGMNYTTTVSCIDWHIAQ